MQGENILDKTNGAKEESGEEESNEDEEESSGTYSDFESSETYTVGGKTSYAAFVNRLDDVSGSLYSFEATKWHKKLCSF